MIVTTKYKIVWNDEGGIYNVFLASEYLEGKYAIPLFTGSISEVRDWIELKEMNEFTGKNLKEYREAFDAGFQEGLQKGREEVLEEINHEQRKLLDGFAHPKDCKFCHSEEIKNCECCGWDDSGYQHEPYCPVNKNLSSNQNK